MVPPADDPHGPLPPLLLALTIVTGLVDAFSYLVLGHVFVANMTGNVVFLGFALAGATGFSIPASLAALGAFSLGALIGGRLIARLGTHRGRLLAVASAVEALLLAAAVAVAATAGSPGSGAARYVLIVLLGLATGTQNAAVRRLAVPDLTTTVLRSRSPASSPTDAWPAGPRPRLAGVCSRRWPCSWAGSAAPCWSSETALRSASPRP